MRSLGTDLLGFAKTRRIILTAANSLNSSSMLEPHSWGHHVPLRSDPAWSPAHTSGSTAMVIPTVTITAQFTAARTVTTDELRVQLVFPETEAGVELFSQLAEAL